MSWIGGLLGVLGSAVSGIFGLKQQQGAAITGAIKVLGDVNASNAQREQAIATVIAAEASSGSWLTVTWRPLCMVVFLGLLVSFWFGYVPPMIDQAMPPMLAEIFGLLKLGIGGYIGGRTLEKIMQQINVSSILKKYIEKKVL